MRHISSFVLVAAIALLTTAAAADSHVKAITQVLPQLRDAIVNDELIKTLRDINKSRKHYTQADIDLLETAWQAQIENPNNYLVESVVRNDIAERLRIVVADSRGLVTQIEIFDDHGISIAQSTPKPGIWLGDERRWRETFHAGPGTVYIDEIQFDALTHTLQSWANFPIEDPNSGRAIGAVAIGINVEAIM